MATTYVALIADAVGSRALAPKLRARRAGPRQAPPAGARLRGIQSAARRLRAVLLGAVLELDAAAAPRRQRAAHPRRVVAAARRPSGNRAQRAVALAPPHGLDARR